MAFSQELKFTKSECHSIVAKKLKTENFTLLDLKQIAFDKVQGYLGHHSKLKITIKRNGSEETHNFFVKSLPTVQSQRNFVLEINGFFKEEGFFTKYLNLLQEQSISKVLDDILPTCYLIKNESFVFENLTTKGYSIFSSRDYLTLEYVKSALASLAKLHASGLILEEKKSFKLNEKLGQELAETFYSGCETVRNAMISYKTGTRAIIDLSHNKSMKISSEWFKQKVDEVLDLQKLYTTPSRKFRNTICHGDVWTQNFMFKLENGHPINCVLVDFQSYRYCPPAQDVLSFLHLTTSRDFRERHKEEVLRFYYKELIGILEKFGLKDVISKEEFAESFRFYKRYALVQPIILFQIVLMSEEMASELLSDQEKINFVFFKDKYDFLLKICEKDNVVRQKNFEAMAELREYFEKQI